MDRLHSSGRLERGWLRHVAGGLVVVVLACGCVGSDPGWTYRVSAARPTFEDGQRYRLDGPSAVGLRVYASLFTSSLKVEIDLTNADVSDLDVGKAGVGGVDRDGNVLNTASGDQQVSCVSAQGDAVQMLSKNGTCRLRQTFVVSPDAKKLGIVMISVVGLARGTDRIQLSVRLDKD